MNEISQQSSYHLSEQVISQAAKDPQARTEIIRYEYKFLSVYAHKYSLILVPKMSCITEWHGLVTISYGIYSPAKIKFILTFPKTFPQTIPRIRLLAPLFHPLIDEQGNVDVESLIPHWRYGQGCMLFNLLQKFYEMFIDTSFFEYPSSFNPEASLKFVEDLNQYAEKVKAQVQQQNEALYSNRDDFELKLSPPDDRIREILQKVGEINEKKDLSFQQKKKQLLQYLIQ